MAGSRRATPLGIGGVHDNTQDGTMCRQSSPLRCPLGTPDSTLASPAVAWLIAQQAFRLPVTINEKKYRGFDWILHRDDGSASFHAGADYYCSDLKAMATSAGVVRQMIRDGHGDHLCGNSVIMEHTLLDHSKVYSTYFHLASFAPELAVGQAVLAGDVLGKIGKTGFSNDIVHLHFELKLGATLANPKGVGSCGAGMYYGYVPTTAGDQSVASATSYGYIDPNTYYGKQQAKTNCTIWGTAPQLSSPQCRAP